MNKKIYSRLINIISIMIISLSLAQIANSTIYGGGFSWQSRPSGSRQILSLPYTTQYAPDYHNDIVNAEQIWTSTSTPLYLNYSNDFSTSKIDFYTGDNNTLGRVYGLTHYNTGNPTRTYQWANIYLNTESLSTYFGSFMKSKVIIHETGHAIGLDHTVCGGINTNCWYSVMYAGDADASSVYLTHSPTQYDVNEVNSIYPGW